jgi:V/A-type H+-transporting ATPase subunit A
MGASALPPAERATILGGRLIREGLLQQSALSTVDGYCDSDRTAALAEMVLAVSGRCQALARAGVPPAVIEEQDFSLVLRARDEAATPAEVVSREHAMLSSLAGLEPGPGAGYGTGAGATP